MVIGMFVLVVEAGACLAILKDELKKEKKDDRNELTDEEQNYITNDILATKQALKFMIIDELEKEKKDGGSKD